MKAVKAIVVGILGIIATMMIVSVFIPSEVILERRIIINAPKEHVFNQVNSLDNLWNWLSWLSSDPLNINKDTGTADCVGNAFEWSNGQRKPRTEKIFIANSNPFEVVEITIQNRTVNPLRSTFKFDEIADGILVSWTMHTDMGKSPYQKYRGLFLDKALGLEMDESLINLKNYSERESKVK